MSDLMGAMRETLILQRNTPPTFAVASLTQVAGLATVTTTTPHGLASQDRVQLAGALPAGYNVKAVITVTGASAFTCAVSAALSTPATGTITVTYLGDAQGGRRPYWVPITTGSATPGLVKAEPIPLSALENMQLQAVQSTTNYRFRIWARPDLDATMRALWTPSWPPSAPTKTLQITGITYWDDPGSGADRFLNVLMTEQA